MGSPFAGTTDGCWTGSANSAQKCAEPWHKTALSIYKNFRNSIPDIWCGTLPLFGYGWD